MRGAHATSVPHYNYVYSYSFWLKIQLPFLAAQLERTFWNVRLVLRGSVTTSLQVILIAHHSAIVVVVVAAVAVVVAAIAVAVVVAAVTVS